jgi:5-methyltetrahydrofolate--homocysteine methyltransferase
MTSPTPAPLAFKPNLEEANRRWEAFYAGEIMDRPLVWVTAPREGCAMPPTPTYRERVFNDIDAVLQRALAIGEATYWGGEAIPSYFLSFGPDELAAFCGAEFRWKDESSETNWSVPFVEDWERALPLRFQEDHPLWQRMLAMYRRAAELFQGKMLATAPDLHSNMDLLAAIRGPQRLCEDLLDCPELIDQAMQDARAIFRTWWAACAEAGRMDEAGYCQTYYGMEGAAILQCDFSCMISPAMFRRWVLPALEEEAEIVKHALYHWDGPGAVVHTADLVASRGLHSLSYVPGVGRGAHIDYLPLLKRVQAGGKAVQVWGTPDEVKIMHRELRPEKVFYCVRVQSPGEAEALLEWFVRHT